jgi:SulP family sulfate permease
VLQSAGIDAGSNPAALFTITLLIGVIMFVLGLLRLGSLVNFVSNAVMTGFVAGASLLILVGELGDLTGYAPSGGDKFLKIIDWATHIGQWDLPTTAVGIGTIIAMLILKKIPQTEKANAVIVLILGTLVVKLLHLPAVELVGNVAHIPSGLPAPVIPDIHSIPKLALGSVAVALVALTQGAGIGSAVPNPDGSRVDQSRDFMGQGLGNMAGSFFQSLGTGGSLSRTGISVGAGAKSRLAGIFSGLWLILIVLLFGKLAELVPLSIIAGILAVVAVELITAKIPDAVLIWKASKGSALTGALTFVSALFIPLQYTIFLGGLLSMVLYIYASASSIRIVRLVPTADGHYETKDVPETYPSGELTIIRLDDLKFFAEVHVLFSRLPKTQGVTQAVVILAIGNLETAPSTTLKALATYSERLRKGGNVLMLANVGRRVVALLEETGVMDTIGRDNVFPEDPVLLKTVDNAVASAKKHLQDAKSS